MRRMLGAVALVIGWVGGEGGAEPPQVRDEGPRVASYPLGDYGVKPRASSRQVLVGLPAIQDELDTSAAQQRAVWTAAERETEQLFLARLGIGGRENSEAARAAIVRETAEAIEGTLSPAQLARLDQIELQAQGPLAFGGAIGGLRAPGGRDLRVRLELGADQVERVDQIAGEGVREIEKAAVVPVIFPPGPDPTPEEIARFVASPAFRASKAKAREDARAAWAEAIGRIEGTLTPPQRAAYRKLLGAPFDLSRLRPQGDEPAQDALDVAAALKPIPIAEVAELKVHVAPPHRGVVAGGGEVQRADPHYDATVARPAYRKTHPRVLFDEGHDNFHKSSERYAPFARLIGNDGYAVTPGTGKFTRAVLATADILVVANAMGTATSGITDGEADAVFDWVRGGGSLLLISDRPPFGLGSEVLGRRFGVEASLAFTSDPLNSSTHPQNLVFSRENRLLGDHPILRGRDPSERVGRVHTFAGQSLQGPVGSVPLLKLAPSAFDTIPGGATTPAGGRAQGLAFSLGQGRVVVLGEAAQLSAQLIGSDRMGMNMPGLDNRQFALNIMHWLSGILDPAERP